MELLRVLLLAVVALGSLMAGGGGASAQEEDEDGDIYKRIFDDVDIDSILDNDRILNVYLHCFFNTGPCNPLAQDMKDKIPEVFSTVCGKCTDKQKDMFRYSLNKFIPKRPDDWKHMLEIYDPQGEYWPKIEEFLKNTS